MTKVLLYSGGLDSFIARFLLKPDVCLYIDIAGKYSASERRRLPSDVIVVHFPGLGQFERKEDLIIPMRNLFFCTVGSMYGEVVMMGATKGDRVLDKSERFAELSSQLLSYLWSLQHWTPGKSVTVELPIKHLTKTALVREYLGKGGDPEKLRTDCFSCYYPTSNFFRCGKCKACYRNWVACKLNGICLEPDSESYIRESILPLICAGSYGRQEEEKEILAALGER